MYHEEKIFQGEYYFKNAETDAWVQMPSRTLTYRLSKAERKVKELEEEIEQLKGEPDRYKFKELDKVEVIFNTSNHKFRVGEVVELYSRGLIDERNWLAIRKNLLKPNEYYYITEDEFELA